MNSSAIASMTEGPTSPARGPLPQGTRPMTAKPSPPTSRIRKLLRKVPLTARGFCILFFSLYLIAGPSWNANDVIATVVGYSLFFILTGFALTTFVQSIDFRERLRAKLSAELFDVHASGSGHARPIAKLPTRMVVTTTPAALVPLSMLSLEVRFASPGVKTAKHLITGRSPSPRTLVEDITFPHRGRWNIASLSLAVGDMWGLTRVTWEDSASTSGLSIEVRPAGQADAHVPVISSAVRTGDAIADLLDRQGDPYDLKQYNPADGMKRILWKVFAKRGELISRMPERAVTPEGQVVCFIAADASGDQVCSEAIRYAQGIAELDLQFWGGCVGNGPRGAARSAEELEQLLIDSVWETQNASSQSAGADLQRLLTQVKGTMQHSRVDKVLILISQARITDEVSTSWHTDLGNLLEKDGITPVFVPLGEQLHARRTQSMLSRAEKLFLYTSQEEAVSDTAFFKRFLGICAGRGWEVIMQQQ